MKNKRTIIQRCYDHEWQNQLFRNERIAEIVILICAAFGSAAVSEFLLVIFHAN